MTLVTKMLLPPVHVKSLAKAYLLQLAVWGLFIVAMQRLPDYRTIARQCPRFAFLQIALGSGFLEALFYAIGGLFSSFGFNTTIDWCV